MTIMMRRRSFAFVYAPKVKAHLKAIETRYHGLIREAIEQRLAFEPDVETRNRKPLRQPAALLAEWEIRFGPNNRFRVLYDIDRQEHTVRVLAIGRKEGNRLRVGGEELEL
jgi:mRNA-degrading endonuclease RelE of RelBE toxin-antitoxin system